MKHISKFSSSLGIFSTFCFLLRLSCSYKRLIPLVMSYYKLKLYLLTKIVNYLGIKLIIWVKLRGIPILLSKNWNISQNRLQPGNYRASYFPWHYSQHICRVCRHKVSQCLFSWYCHCFFFEKRSSRPISLLPPCCNAPSGFCPIAENSPLLPPVGVWAVS